MKILYKILGGRPMTYLDFSFTDVISGLPVNRYRDKTGRTWLANNRWGFFRVEVTKEI